MGPQQERATGHGDGQGARKKEGKKVVRVRYMQCQRNHAAGIGKHAVDGCCEFLASLGTEEEALLCAACGCHRSFHRRVLEVAAVERDCDDFPAPQTPPPAGERR